MCRSKDDSFRPADPAAPPIPEGRTAGEGDAAPPSLAASMASLPPSSAGTHAVSADERGRVPPLLLLSQCGRRRSE